MEGKSKKVKTGGGGAAESQSDAIAGKSLLEKLPEDMQRSVGENLSLDQLTIMTELSNALNSDSNSGFKIELQERRTELQKVGKSIVSGTPRERFDALCAHMKKGENRHSSVKGVPLLNPETGEQYKWESNFEERLVDGLKNSVYGHNGIDLKDVCKFLDSSLPCDTGEFERVKFNEEHASSRYVYVIEIPKDMYIVPYYKDITKISIEINIWKSRQTFVPYICNVGFPIADIYLEYTFEANDTVTEFVQTLEKLINPEDTFSTVTFWDAFVKFSEECTLKLPFWRWDESIKVLKLLLRLFVVPQNYPFFLGEAKGREGVFFRASFVDKCLVP